jgi:hypothetical protein
MGLPGKSTIITVEPMETPAPPEPAREAPAPRETPAPKEPVKV